MDWRNRSGRRNWRLRPVRGLVRCRSIRALRARCSPNSRGAPARHRRSPLPPELDAELGIEREADQARFRSQEPTRAVSFADAEGLCPGTFAPQIENVGLERGKRDELEALL